MSWNNLSTYSKIHALLALKFTRALKKPQDWASVALVPRDSLAGNPFIEDDVGDDEPVRVRMGPPASVPLTGAGSKRSLPPGGGDGEGRRSKRGRLSKEEGIPDPAPSTNAQHAPSTSRRPLPSRAQSDTSDQRKTNNRPKSKVTRKNSSTRTRKRK